MEIRFNRTGDPEKSANKIITGLKQAAAVAKGEAEPARIHRVRVKGELVGVRLQPDTLARLDRYRGGLTRPEAIRRLIEAGVAGGAFEVAGYMTDEPSPQGKRR